MDIPFEYVLPVIRGIQAGHEYYISMCPVRLIPKLFPFDDEEYLGGLQQINWSRSNPDWEGRIMFSQLPPPSLNGYGGGLKESC
jgi:hypothetical protein